MTHLRRTIPARATYLEMLFPLASISSVNRMHQSSYVLILDAAHIQYQAIFTNRRT